MNNAELIEALQCTSHFALYQDCYERNCYANSGKGLYCNIPKLMADAAAALEAAMAEVERKNEAIQGLRSEIADIKDAVRETAVAIWEYDGSYADWILDIIGEADRDIDEIATELTARTEKGDHDE